MKYQYILSTDYLAIQQEHKIKLLIKSAYSSAPLKCKKIKENKL